MSDVTVGLLAVAIAQIAAVVLAVLARIDAQRMEKVAISTHALVNSAMGIQLELNALTTRRLAELSKDPIDEAAAEKAARLHLEHVEGERRIEEAKKPKK